MDAFQILMIVVSFLSLMISFGSLIASIMNKKK